MALSVGPPCRYAASQLTALSVAASTGPAFQVTRDLCEAAAGGQVGASQAAVASQKTAITVHRPLVPDKQQPTPDPAVLGSHACVAQPGNVRKLLVSFHAQEFALQPWCRQVLLSHAVWERLRGSMAAAAFPVVESLGSFRLAGSSEPTWVYQVSGGGGRNIRESSQDAVLKFQPW